MIIVLKQWRFKKNIFHAFTNLKGLSFFLDVNRKLLSVYSHFVRQVFKSYVPFWRYLEKIVFGADPITPLRERVTKTLLLHNVKHILSIFCLLLLFKIFLYFEILLIKISDFWPLKIPNYVTKEINKENHEKSGLD